MKITLRFFANYPTFMKFCLKSRTYNAGLLTSFSVFGSLYLPLGFVKELFPIVVSIAVLCLRAFVRYSSLATNNVLAPE